MRVVSPKTGAMTVEDLVGSPALQLRVLAGASGLGRSVSWAHVCELADPTQWLLGAEVIMTVGYAIPRDAAEQRGYLERLDDTGSADFAEVWLALRAARRLGHL